MKKDHVPDEEQERSLIESLRVHGQLLETSDVNAELPAGVTHILLKKEDEKPKLIRKRMSSIF